MAQFRYKAAHPDGRIMAACIDGESEPLVRTRLEDQGLLILSLKSTESTFYSQNWFSHGRLSLREFLVFNQEFLALIKAGLPILKAFDLLSERTSHHRFQGALQHVRAGIRGGASISDAMAECPHHFSDLYRASLRSGEHTGNLAEVLQRYIAYLKLLIGVREKVVKAMAYPLFLIVVGIAVVTFLLVYVIPNFADIYGKNKAQLPIPTLMLLTAVEHSQQWFPWFCGIGIAVLMLVYQWLHTAKGRGQLNRLSLTVPIIGDIFLKSEIVRFARTLSTILAGGIPLLSALHITGGATTNSVIAHAISHAADRVREGVSLAAALKQEGILPQMTLEMIEVGETTGSLQAMLQDIAEFHEGELELRLNQLMTWIEPVLLLVMGIIVGGIVIVMYLPIFQMAGTV